MGIPVPGVQVKIDAQNEDQEGEILVKGPNVMQGYYKRPKLTKEVFTADGWLRTGDIGKIIEGKFLAITDRKKSIFKTSAGKYIAPQQLENHFTKSHFIEQCMVVGFQRPYVTGLIVPNFEFFGAMVQRQRDSLDLTPVYGPQYQSLRKNNSRDRPSK